VERFTGIGVIEMIRLGLLMLGIVGLLFWQSPDLAAIALLPMIPLVLVTTGFGSRVGDLFMKVDIALGELSALVQENVSGVQVIRAFAREPYEIERFDQANRAYYRARIKVIYTWAVVMPSLFTGLSYLAASTLAYGPMGQARPLLLEGLLIVPVCNVLAGYLYLRTRNLAAPAIATGLADLLPRVLSF